LPGFALFLKQTRETSLAAWVSAVADDTDIHSLENRLQESFFHLIREMASWVPTAWRPAVLWSQTLFELPAVAAEQSQPASQQERVAAWVAEWRSLWPGVGNWRNQLEELIRLVLEHMTRFATLQNAEQAIAARQEFQAVLVLRFRRFAATPAALFVFLLLQSLDYERLRGGLASRLLFHGSGEGEVI
jgi:hypothetical protein